MVNGVVTAKTDTTVTIATETDETLEFTLGDAVIALPDGLAVDAEVTVYYVGDLADAAAATVVAIGPAIPAVPAAQ